MDNLILNYENDITSDESSDEELIDNRNTKAHSMFMGNIKSSNYERNRNKLFTPEIIKKYFTIHLTTTPTSKSLEEHFNLPTKNS